MKVEAQVIKVAKFGDTQICSLIFNSGFIPKTGMVLTARNNICIKITGIMVHKRMLPGVFEHPDSKGVYECKFQIVSKDHYSLEEGTRLYYTTDKFHR